MYHQPNNLFVADFVGNPSINFVEAKGAQRADGAVELTVFQGRKALFRPSTPLDLSQWFRDRAAQAAAWGGGPSEARGREVLCGEGQ